MRSGFDFGRSQSELVVDEQIMNESCPDEILLKLGLTKADEPALRKQLAAQLNDLIQERRLTQTVVAGIFGIPQPHISELRNYKLGRFSAERLLRFITLLDRDVEIVIRPKDQARAEGVVSVMVTV